MASDGPRYPSSVTTSGVAPENANDWVTPSNVGADDGNEATITAATFDANDISFRLLAQGLGFSILAGSTINGITVEIEKRDQNIGNAVDYRVQLLDQNSALVGNNKADTVTGWPTNATIISYGGTADTWGASPTVDMVNSANFGVVLSAQATAANTDIFVDFIRVTIEYTPPATRRAQVSWAEMEVPTAPRRARVSWTELEVPDPPIVQRRAQVSWSELEVPNAPRRARVSWSELEVPNSPRRARVSWTELEVPNGPRRAQVSWAELEVPTAPRRGQVSWAEMETPNPPRRARVSWAELQVPDVGGEPEYDEEDDEVFMSVDRHIFQRRL